MPKQTRWKDLRGVRYMEVFLIGSKPVDGLIKGACYNTTGLNTSGKSSDSCPQALVDKLDAEKLAKEYHRGQGLPQPAAAVDARLA